MVVPVCHSGHPMVRHSSHVLRRSSLSRALLIALLGGLCLAPGAIADNTAIKPDLPPPAAPPIASSVPVGRGDGSTDAPALPGGVSSSGLTAGAGSVDIREYVDMSSAACGKSHQRIVPTLLRRVAAEGLGSVSLRPLITSRDMNSTEAGTAIIAAEKLGRVCFALDLEPRYVQAAVTRWERFTGATATRHRPARPGARRAATRRR